MLLRRSSNIVPFMKHSDYGIFKVKYFLNLVSWFSFNVSCPNSMCKTYFFLSFWVLRERSIDIFFEEHSLYTTFNVQSVLIFYCWFYFVSSYPNSTCKTFLFRKLLVFYEKNSDIDRVLWKIARILLDDFDLSPLTRIPYKKDTNCKNCSFLWTTCP